MLFFFHFSGLLCDEHRLIDFTKVDYRGMPGEGGRAREVKREGETDGETNRERQRETETERSQES